MPIVQITGPISQPLVLDRGYSVSITPLAGSYRVQIPGEGVSDSLSAASSYGPYSTRREVVISIDSGAAEYDVDESGGGQSSVSGSRGLQFARWNPVLDGVTDNTAKFLDACSEAQGLGVPLVLPESPFVIAQTAVIDRLIGTPGKSKIILAPDFTLTGYGNQFAFLCSSFTTGARQYNEATAATVEYRGFSVETNPNTPRSIFGLCNVNGGVFDRVNIKVGRVVVSGKPVKSDALIDLYACVKRVAIENCQLRNVTGAWLTNKVAEGGGGAIWIRNFRSGGGDASVDATEGNVVKGNYIEHWTSDEAVAIYGVRGITRKNQIVGNVIVGLSSIADAGPYRSATVSIFPLQDNSSGAGVTAAVTENTVKDNTIIDSSWLYNILRIGNSSDASRECWGNVSSGNSIVAIRSSDATSGPQATWVAAGSSGSNPDATCAIIRCIEGTSGSAYFGNISGNISAEDKIFVPTGGAQANAGALGWQRLVAPVIRGNVYNGAVSCRNVESPDVEAFARAFTNCNHVAGGEAFITGSAANYAVQYIDSTSAGNYSMRNVRVAGGGALTNVASTTAAGSFVSVSGCSGSRSGATSGGVINDSSANVRAHLNVLTGVISSPAGGGGTVTRSLNYWAGTSD